MPVAWNKLHFEAIQIIIGSKTHQPLFGMSKQILPESKTRTLGNSVCGIVRKLFAFFQGFTEADARALLSAYGLYEVEVDHIRQSRPDQRKEISRNLGGLVYGDRIDRWPGPIPIGVHPDLIRATRTNTRRNHS
jgi:hypothetical protein